MSNCCGNWWAPSGLSTKEVCGDFTEPEHPDLGQCFPFRVKRTCERPDLPVAACDDETFYAEYTPSLTPPFRVVAGLYDESCLPILDETGAQILTLIA